MLSPHYFEKLFKDFYLTQFNFRTFAGPSVKKNPQNSSMPKAYNIMKMVKTLKRNRQEESKSGRIRNPDRQMNRQADR